ncbi:hypothetical protein A1Q1_02159 [Trichosporon asahii var. asahii CBS 2479]|uniref:Uncharacterized protein n=1 Tax=Trichosporon asahii var. asahii (strain ATCC 90039 / CBS 2479 / JCM 2466 / KCTC 7840 / NBRC 103889/ NCYC 2677 / UAMH 7654) TaxID=1186058 RepID=J6EW22_TRIAS|nr:hypothetical protein A1Q1_02159 [Trichosporon asahii var. asahii CBS 2479]EJT48824.1 hypothetical protein A1Q1_02159 [Trichosporon asahii var. asahii CBS 2479]
MAFRAAPDKRLDIYNGRPSGIDVSYFNPVDPFTVMKYSVRRNGTKKLVSSPLVSKTYRMEAKKLVEETKTLIQGSGRKSLEAEESAYPVARDLSADTIKTVEEQGKEGKE